MELGKPRRKVLSSTVWRLTGAKSREVITGPSFGVDVSVVRLRDRRVMVTNCDPISLIPSLGPKDSGIMSVYEVASDVATSGQPPRYALFDLNLPPKTSDHIMEEYWRSISSTCLKLGVSIIGGHTGRFEGCDYSIVGSGTMWTICDDDEYLTSSMARNGDDLILTKSAAYGATGVLAKAFRRTVRRYLGSSLFRRASDYFEGSNTVNDSLTAVEVGIHEQGVTAIHDVTEGGVFAAVLEMARASRLGAIIDVAEIPVSEETALVSKLFGIDPLTSLGEGSLLIASRPYKTRRVTERLRSAGIEAAVVGRLSSKLTRVIGVMNERQFPIRYPMRDPYWRAYSRAVRKGWS